MFDEDARGALIDHLGFTQEVKEEMKDELPVVEEKEEKRLDEPAPITAEDLFASAPMMTKASESVEVDLMH